MRRSIGIILLFVIVCLISGYISILFQKESLIYWYPLLKKSIFTPPDFIFFIVWIVLYILMGISIGLIMIGNNDFKIIILVLFISQLIFNIVWSMAFFYFRDPLLALLDIFLLEVFIVYYALKAYSVNKLSSLLFIPYGLWVGFAAYLNYYIYDYNY